MANQVRFRSGQVQLVKARVDTATVIEAGDLVYLESNKIKPASDFPWDTDLATTQASFAALFLGVAHQGSAVDQTQPVSVDISPLSVYEFDTHSSAYELGDFLGPDEDASTLMKQQLESVADPADAIARAVQYKESSAATLRVSFASAYHVGSSNSNAALG